MNVFRRRRPGDPVLRLALRCTAIFFCIMVANEAIPAMLLRIAHGNYGIVQGATVKLYEAEHFLILVIIGVYALIRSQRFHPALIRPYRQWLTLTPWKPADPLPLGSVLLTLADAIPLAAAFLTAYLVTRTQSPLPAVVFLAVYLVGSLGWLHSTKRIEFWWVWYGLGLLLLPVFSMPWLLALVVALYTVVHRAFLHSLSAFPWGLDDPKPAKPIANWPLSRIGPVELETQSDFVRWCGIWNKSLLIGWWVFCILTRWNVDSLIDNKARSQAVLWCIFIGETMAVFRWCVYHQLHCHAPISLWGRVWTGLWIIPGYDRALIAPLILSMLAIALPFTLNALRLPVPLLSGLFIGVMWGLSFSLGPALWLWKLTGQYQMLPQRKR